MKRQRRRQRVSAKKRVVLLMLATITDALFHVAGRQQQRGVRALRTFTVGTMRRRHCAFGRTVPPQTKRFPPTTTALFVQQQQDSFRQRRHDFQRTIVVAPNKQQWYHHRNISSRLFATSSTTLNNNNNNKEEVTTNNTSDEDDTRLYAELKWLAEEIQRHDALYYSGDASQQDAISDDEYDALCQKEAELCQRYPLLRLRLEKESGKGIQATRYGGRVGTTTTLQTEDTNNNDTEGSQATSVVSSSPPSAAAAASSSSSSLVRTKRRHLKPMLSLDNVHDNTQLFAWLERIRKKVNNNNQQHEQTATTTTSEATPALPTFVAILTEPKLDGLSLNLYYKKHADDNSWKLQWATTRGDGRQGQDVTHAVRSIDNVPLTLKSTAFSLDNMNELEVRGEVVLPQSVFQQQQQQNKNNNNSSLDTAGDDNNATTTSATKFANARNAAAGILLRKETTSQEHHNASKATAASDDHDWSSKLVFYAYDLYIPTVEQIDSSQARNLLESMGFGVPWPCVTTHLPLETVATANNDTSSSSNDSNNNTATTNETTTNTTIRPWDEEDISTMLDYYNALRIHREEDNNDPKDPATKKTKNVDNDSTSSCYEWGDYDMDGCVHKLDSWQLKSLLGYSNRAPRWAVAHKFPPTAAVTQLLDITVQVGRTGALTPVAVLEPVALSGVTIQRATLHNFGHLQQILGGPRQGQEQQSATMMMMMIPRGSDVLVRRAGEVIPQVVSVVGEHRGGVGKGGDDTDDADDSMISLSAPTHCPACNSTVVVDTVRTPRSSMNNQTASSQDEDAAVGQVIRCGGPPLLCPPRAVSALQHAFSRDALDVSGLSEGRIQHLMDAGLLRLPSDVFALAQEPGTINVISELEGWGTKSAQNLVASADRVATKGVSLARFIYSLGIRFAGVHSSAQIAGLYGTVEAFLEDVDKAGRNQSGQNENATSFEVLRADSESTKGIGPALLGGMEAFANEKELVEAAKQLAEKVVVHRDDTLQRPGESPERSVVEGPLVGLSIVFTGSLPGMSRSAAQEVAKQMGAKATPSRVSRSTDLVVSGDKGGKKLEDASNMGIKIMETEEYLALVQAFKDAET